MAEVRLVVAGKAFGGWKSITIEQGIEQLSGAYELSVSAFAPNSEAADRIVPGAAATISVDGQTIITGYIDDVDISESIHDHTLTVRGRDAAGDLVDCSAAWRSGAWLNQGMLTIVKDLVAPFKIPVHALTDLGKPFLMWNVEPSETVFNNIDKMAKHRGVLVFSDGLGGLLMTLPGTQRVATALVRGQNILSGTALRSYAQRYSRYIVYGQRPPDDNTDPMLAARQMAITTDPNIIRYRPKIEFFEDANGDIDVLTKRAGWRKAVAIGKSQSATLIVQGWRHAQGLWQPNTLVNVAHAGLRLNNLDLLIVGVKRIIDMQGSRTELKLSPREAYLVEDAPDTRPLDEFFL